jgi:hypothetical protein
MHAAAIKSTAVVASATTVKSTAAHVATTAHMAATTAMPTAAAMTEDSDWSNCDKDYCEDTGQPPAPRAKSRGN